MSTAVTVPFLAPEDRTRIHFSAATMRLLNASIAATQDALQRFEAPYQKTDPAMGPFAVSAAPVDPTVAVLQEAMKAVSSIGAAAVDMPTMPLKLSSCYNMNYFASGVADDSCVSTEIDKVFASYLIELATMDKARWDFQPGTEPVAGGMVQNDTSPSSPAAPARGAFNGSAGMPRWEWGPVVARTVPNKVAQSCVVVFTVLTVLLLILLHWMTSPLTALTGSDLCPEGFRDATPWMAFADAEHPPEALKDLTGLPVDEAVKHEGSKGIVMGLVQVDVQRHALQASTGPTAAVSGPSPLAPQAATHKEPTKPHTIKWVFTVEQGWQLWADWDKFVQAKQSQGDPQV